MSAHISLHGIFNWGLITLGRITSTSSSSSGPRAVTDTGTVQGITTMSTLNPSAPRVDEYKGIPFGTIPRRFDIAEPAPRWSGVLDASTPGLTCYQQFSYPNEMRDLTMEWYNTPPPMGGEGEDCLNLNIFTPSHSEPGSKAVLLWLYGGSFKFGSGALPIYEGSDMAANQDVVVVTINYRTNVFGFPGSADIPEEKRNLGFYDQRLALDWVQRNIHAFGGDPTKVTIFGESAGGGSVDALVTLPPKPVPFRAAIMQSGQCSVFVNKFDGLKSWKQLAKFTGCSDTGVEIECMRRIPAIELKSLQEEHKLTFFPVTDGVTWAKRPRTDRLASRPDNSAIARVPILIGSNADEGTLLQYQRPPTMQKRFGLFAFQCPAAVVATESHAVGIPTWRYFFNATFPNTNLFDGAGAYHSSEVKLIFGTYPHRTSTAAQRVLGAKIQKAWADFAKDPETGPGWDQTPAVGMLNGATADITTRSEAGDLDKGCGGFKLVYDVVALLQ